MILWKHRVGPRWFHRKPDHAAVQDSLSQKRQDDPYTWELRSPKAEDQPESDDAHGDGHGGNRSPLLQAEGLCLLRRLYSEKAVQQKEPAEARHQILRRRLIADQKQSPRSQQKKAEGEIIAKRQTEQVLREVTNDFDDPIGDCVWYFIYVANDNAPSGTSFLILFENVLFFSGINSDSATQGGTINSNFFLITGHLLIYFP